MIILSWKEKLRGLFIAFCVILTIVTVVRQIGTFVENNEVAEVSFRMFHVDKIDVYPSVSLFFKDEFNDNELRKYGKGINASSYGSFLRGGFWNPDMLNISYSKVSKNLKTKILRIGAYLENWDQIVYYNTYDKKSKNPPILVSSNPLLNANEYSLSFYSTLLTMNVPFKRGQKLRSFFIDVKADVFPNGIRHPFNFGLILHYPNQIGTAQFFSQYFWPHRGNESSTSYIMRFNVAGIEVVQLRKNGPHPCNSEASNNLDEFMYQKLVVSQGCQPPYFDSFSYLPPCWKREQLKEFYSELWKFYTSRSIQPCRDMKNVQFDMMYLDLKEQNDPYFQILINYRADSYKQIKNIRAMDVQALIGNTGGYIGLFLGYALLNVPDLLSSAFIQVWSKIFGLQNRST